MLLLGFCDCSPHFVSLLSPTNILQTIRLYLVKNTLAWTPKTEQTQRKKNQAPQKIGYFTLFWNNFWLGNKNENLRFTQHYSDLPKLPGNWNDYSTEKNSRGAKTNSPSSQLLSLVPIGRLLFIHSNLVHEFFPIVEVLFQGGGFVEKRINIFYITHGGV